MCCLPCACRSHPFRCVHGPVRSVPVCAVHAVRLSYPVVAVRSACDGRSIHVCFGSFGTLRFSRKSGGMSGVRTPPPPQPPNTPLPPPAVASAEHQAGTWLLEGAPLMHLWHCSPAGYSTAGHGSDLDCLPPTPHTCTYTQKGTASGAPACQPHMARCRGGHALVEGPVGHTGMGQGGVRVQGLSAWGPPMQTQSFSCSYLWNTLYEQDTSWVHKGSAGHAMSVTDEDQDRTGTWPSHQLPPSNPPLLPTTSVHICQFKSVKS